MNAIVDLTTDEMRQAQAAAHAQPLTVIEHAMRAGATPDQLERLLDLQVRADNHQLELMREKRRMDEEDRKAAALLAYRRDFAAFRGENIVVAKDKEVNRGAAGSFMQAEFHNIAQLLSPALSKHGFSFRHDQRFDSKEWPTAENPGNRIGWVFVTCFLEHKDGHAETLALEGPEGDLKANTAVQNMQATASYLKRQSLLAITGTATGGEDDESRLRDKGKQRTQEGSDWLEELRGSGQEKAMEGMAALTSWWGSLTSRQRTELSPEFKTWRGAAAAADKQPQAGAPR